MSLLLSVIDTEVMASGVYDGPGPLSVPLWASGENVIFRAKSLRSLKGTTALYTVADVNNHIRGVFAHRKQDGTLQVLTGDTAELYLWDGTTNSSVGSGFTGIDDATSTQVATTWTFDAFQDWSIATNGVDRPQIRKGSGSFTPFSNLTDDPILNGNFTIDLGWTKGTNWQITGGVASQTSPTASSLSQATGALTSGSHYRLDFTVGSMTTGQLLVYVDSVLVKTVEASGSYNEPFLAGGTGTVTFTADGTWDGDVDAVSLHPGITFTKARKMLTRGSHVLAFNTDDQGSNAFQWADARNPEQWYSTTTNTAGFQIMYELEDEIQDAVIFGRNIMAFGKNHAFLISYVGAPFYFTYRLIAEGIGAVGAASTVAVGRYVYGFGPTGIWRVDEAGSYEYIADPAIRDYISSNLDTSQRSKAWAAFDPCNQVVWFGIPTAATGEPTLQVGFSVENGSWTMSNLARTCAIGNPEVYDCPVMVDAAGVVYQHDTGTDDNGTTLVKTARTKALDMWRVDGAGAELGGPQQYKDVNAIIIDTENVTGTVQVRVGSADTNDDAAITWEAWVTLLGTNEIIPLDVNGAIYIFLEFQTVGAGASFDITGMIFYGDYAGSAITP